MISKVFEICNAYESGYGHGVNNDGLNDDYYSDSELNEAYHIGYEAGFNNMFKTFHTKPIIIYDPSKEK